MQMKQQIMSNREFTNSKGYEDSGLGRRHSNHKFLSIKSVIRNKKIIVKKSMPNTNIDQSNFNISGKNITNSNENNHKTQNYPTHPNNTNVVNIQFSQHFSLPNKNASIGGFTQQSKAKKKLIMQNLFLDQNKRSYKHSLKERPSSSFTQTLVIEPLQKATDTKTVGSQKKKYYTYQQNQYLNAARRTSQKSQHSTDPMGTYRTLSSLKPVGKQIIMIKGNLGNRNYHRTSTALGKQSHQRQKKKKMRFIVEQRRAWGIEDSELNFCFADQTNAKQENDSLAISSKMYSNKHEEEDEKLFIQDFNARENEIVMQNQKDMEKQKQKLINEAIMEEFKDFLPLRKPVTRKDYFVFGMSDKPSNEPQNKIQLYRDFLWKINYSNSLYVYTPETIDYNYRAYFGFGNNSCMLKSIMRRRYWWTITDSLEGCQFVWTQLKINSLFKHQICRSEPKYVLYESTKEDQNLYQRIREKNKFRGQGFEEEDLGVSMQIGHAKIFNFKDWKQFEKHQKKYRKSEQKITQQTYMKRLKLYGKKQIAKIGDSNKIKVHNHLQFNYYLGNKKALFYNIKRLCECRGIDPFEFIPLTFHISKGVTDPVYQDFLKYYSKFQQTKKNDKNFKNMWIAKPGENTNRGNGISVCFGIDDIRHRLRGKQKNSDGKPRTFILQKYIEKPFLYKNRKFDIRHYILITCFNGSIKAYWFDEGYIRTSSSPFCLKNNKDVLVHLTNDAVQKKSDSYGKHEKGNKISYEDFQKYISSSFKKKKYDFLGETLQKMKEIALLAIESTYSLLDTNRKENNFELIGLDFMIDEDFKPWLIEANTNPCLELSCPLLQKLIPNLIEQTFRICVDPFFPPPENFINKKQFFGENPLLQNKFELIFDEVVDGQAIQKLFKEAAQKAQQFSNAIGKIEEDDEVFEDDGNDKWQQKDKNT